MKKNDNERLRNDYRSADFGKGVRGKHLKCYRAGTNLVLLRPDVAAVFPTDEAVNKALGFLIEVAESVGAATRPTKPRQKRQTG
ncbi:MAG: hypothetical protein ACOY8P_10045 [Thermodesulfobacteriota bacterium]|jgi:hypothetical protein